MEALGIAADELGDFPADILFVDRLDPDVRDGVMRDFISLYDNADKLLARSRGLSVNKLMEELAARALANWDVEQSFRAMAARGDVERALVILDRLDAKEADKHPPTTTAPIP